MQQTSQALICAMFCLSYPEAVATLESSVRARQAQLGSVLAAVRRRSAALADALATDVDLGSRSHVEVGVRLALRRSGLHVLAGAKIPGLGEVDFLVEGFVIVEIDGYAYHSDRKQYRADRRRDRRAARLGLVVLRYSYEDALAVGDLLAEVHAFVKDRGNQARAPIPSVSDHDVEALRTLQTAGVAPGTARVSRRLREWNRSSSAVGQSSSAVGRSTSAVGQSSSAVKRPPQEPPAA